MNRLIIFFLILLAGAPFCLSGEVLAQPANKPEGLGNTLQELKGRGKIIAGVPAHEAPFGFTDEKGGIKGINVDIAEALGKEIWGREGRVEFVKVKVETMLNLLKSGKIDILLAPLSINEERGRIVDFSVPCFVSGYLILVERESRISRYEDLAGKKLAVIEGTQGERIIQEFIPTVKPVRFRENSQALQALKEHQVDAFLQLDVFVFYMEAKEKNLRVVGWQSIAPSPMGLAVRKGDKEWLDFVDIVLLRMMASGQYRKLLDKWFGTVRGEFLDLALRNEIKLRK
jgi:aspartate/glutamate/glutamine transport system substrate-binding protein